MGRRHSLALVAGAATILASLPLFSVFNTASWLFYAVICVSLVVGTAMLVRTLRGPVYAQVLAMLAMLLLFLTWTFPSGREIAGLIPTGATFTNFNELLRQAGSQIRDQAVPVPDLDGILLLTTAGIGLVAMLVDLTAVGIRRPALAGLPMLAIYSVPVAVLPGGVNVFAFFFGAAGYLWLLVTDSVDRVRRFGRRFSGEGRDVDLWEPSPLSAAGRRLGVVGLVVAILIPLAVPGMTAGFLDRFGTGPGGESGGEGARGDLSKVDLTALLRDNLVRGEQFEMVKVRTNDPAPYYLRLGTAEQITNNGFDSILPNSNSLPVTKQLPDFVPPTSPGVSNARYRADIEIVNLDQKLAPAYQQLTVVNGLDNTWFFDPGTNQVYSLRNSANGKRYTIDYVRLGFSPTALRTASPVSRDSGAQALTTVPIIAQVTDLVSGLIKGKTNPYDRVRAIYEYFSPTNGFAYSLNADKGDSGSAIVDFLTNKRGFCVQYAAAMAWLVRTAGYPARVAFGFTRGAGPRSGVYSLTNLNLHAWTEVFFQDFGWVPFDATPPGQITGSVSPAWAPDANAPVIEESSASPGASTTAGAPLPSGPVDGGPDDGFDGLNPTESAQTTNLWLIAGAVAAVIAFIFLLAPSARRRALRRGRRARSGRVIELVPQPSNTPLALITDPAGIAAAQRDAHSAWAELLDTMLDFGIPVDASETPRSTGDRLSTLPELAPPGRVQAGVLAQAEERARYARMPLRADALDEAVKIARKSFAQRATRTQRVQAILFPRSVLARWRMGWILLASRNARAAERVRDALLLVNPRRLITRSR